MPHVLTESSNDEGGQLDTALPPGVSQEDVDLFKLAQEKAQDLMNKVSYRQGCTHLSYMD